MVGYAYSADAEQGYNYITIKSYNCDDISFVNNNTPYQIYRVNRQNLSAELLFPEKTDTLKHLSYKNITEIFDKLIRAEYSADYPVCITWAVSVSGICEIKSKEILSSMWPLAQRHLESSIIYINITDILFNSPPLYFKASFAAEVINEAIYCCGIYLGDFVTVIGDELFCTANMVSFLKKLFKKRMFYNVCSRNFGRIKYKSKGISRRRILNRLRKNPIELNFLVDFPAKELCKIKRQCISDILQALNITLKNQTSFDDFLKEVIKAFDKAFYNIDLQKSDFVFYSGGRPEADVNYLTFKDLIEVFTFGNSKNEMSDKIRQNRLRKRALKNLEVPKVIYNGRMYFNY